MEITNENLPKIDIKKLALNPKFGDLIFEKSYSKLEQLKKMFVEFNELEFSNNLTDDEISGIQQRKNRFVGFLTQINNFNIAADGINPKETHDNLENEIINLYNDTSQSLRTSLVFLRQEAALKSKDEQGLQDQQKKALQAETEYKKLSEKLQKEIESLEKRKKKIDSSYGEVATKQLAHHFAKQANDYEQSKNKWLDSRSSFYKWIILIVSANLLLFIGIFVFGDLFEKIPFKINNFFTVEYAVIKIAFLSFLSIGLSFTSRNYNIESNLTAINKHRKNVAQTLEDFLATNPDDETRSQMIKQGTEAMFKNESTGYISKREQSESGSIYKIINNLPTGKS